MIRSCMFCEKQLDAKKDKGRYCMNIDVVRVKKEPSPFSSGTKMTKEKAMQTLWLCDTCGSRMVSAIDSKRVD